MILRDLMQVLRLVLRTSLVAGLGSCGGAGSETPLDAGHGNVIEVDSQAPADAAIEDATTDRQPADAETNLDAVDTGVADVRSDAAAGCMSGPQTYLHYTAGWNGTSGGPTLGFNVADVSSAAEVSALPAGMQALVWLGLCNGADANFVSTVQPFAGLPNVYGFYLMDEPDPTGQYLPPACPAANLKAESDWIHANILSAKTFIIMLNLGSDTAPSYQGSYNPANTGIDLYGLDPYPCQAAYNGCDYTEIASSVAAAKAWGIPEVAIIPVYQAFGGGGYAQWTLPTAPQEQTILKEWASAVPKPAFDYAYAWGSQQGDTALSQSPPLQSVFAAHMQSTCLPGGDP
jgi:hypothetical protein